jgi:pectinesterase
MKIRILALWAALWTTVVCAAPKPDAVVAADGSAQYKTVRAAIDACPQLTKTGSPRWTILVKPGTYRELIYIQREKRYISLVGEDAATTKITFDLFNDYVAPDGQALATFRTATVALDADDFTVENLTLENSAVRKGQALAIRVDGDRVVFRRCIFRGWQDTILINRGRHYFEDCTIEGATDFIFGGATAWFERCTLRVLGDGYITAASTPDFAAHGYVFSHCRIEGATPAVRTFLGRPWRDYAQTVFLHTEMGEVVKPAGWDDWKKPQAHATTRYAEFASTGPGATPEKRAPWSKQLTAAQAASYTLTNVLGGEDRWDPRR